MGEGCLGVQLWGTKRQQMLSGLEVFEWDRCTVIPGYSLPPTFKGLHLLCPLSPGSVTGRAGGRF